MQKHGIDKGVLFRFIFISVHHGVLLANRYLITNEVIAVMASLKTHAIIEWQGID